MILYMIDNNKNIRYMNMKTNLMMLLCAFALLVSCTTEEQEQIAVSNGTAVSISSAEIPPVGGQVNFTISANVNWRISSKPEWLSVSKTAGASGTSRMSLSADLNQTYDDRSGTITIAATDGSFRENIQVFQEHAYLNISDDDFDFLWDDTKTFSKPGKSLNVECNTEWAIFVVDNSNGTRFNFEDSNGMKKYDWLLMSQIAGEDDGVLEFNPYLYNIEREPHTMRLQLAGLDRNGSIISGRSYYLDFTQANLRFVVDVLNSYDDENLSYAACRTTDKTIEIDSELDWSVQSAPSWVTITKRSGAGNQTAQTVINIEGANPGSSVRSGDVVLVSDANTSPLPTRTINVKQEGYVFNTNTSTVTVDSWDYNASSVSVYSSGSWQIDNSSIPSWLDVPTTSGTGDPTYGEQVTFVPNGQNYDLSNRTANLKFQSTQPGNTMSLTKKYVQSAFQFKATAATPAINTYSTDDHNLAILSDGEWSASVSYEGTDTGWLQLSTESGDKDTNISYKAKTPNETLQDRKATITLVSETHKAMGQDVKYEVPITHRKYVFEVSPQPAQLQLAYTAVDVTPSRKTISVECSADWTVTCPDWVTIWYNSYGYSGSCQGSGDATLQIAVDNNLTSSSRSGKIVISSVVGKYEYNISQEGYVFSVPNINLSVGAVSGSSSQYSYTCSGEWEIQNCPKWITFNPSSGSASPESRQFNFTYELNSDLTSRSATVKFVSLLDGQSKTFTVKQDAFEFNSTAQTFSYEALNSTSNTISVVCTGAWEIVNAPAWVNCSVTSGTGNTSFTIKPANNVELDARDETFQVRSKLVPSYTKSITVKQKAFVFDTAATSFSYEPLETGEKSVTFNYIGGNNMSVSGTPNWLTVTTSSTSSTYTMKFAPTKNTSDSERTATITLTSGYNTALKKTVTIKQSAYKFSASKTTLSLGANETDAKTITVTSTGKWTVSTDASWLKLSSTGATGNGSFTITATANTAKDAKERSASVVITCGDDITKKITINVTQAKP